MSERTRSDVFMEFNRWGWDAKGWAQNTRTRYLYKVRAADQWLRNNRNVSVVWATPKDLSAYLFSTKPTPQTRNDVRAALVAFGNFLVANEWRDDNPALHLPRLPVPKSIPKALDRNQAERLRRASSHFSQQNHTLIMVLLYGGFRRDEVRRLEWHRVGAGGDWISVVGKGNKERQVSLHKVAAGALMGWKNNCPSPRWVFPSPRFPDRPISRTSMANIVTEIGASAGFPELHPHALRHTVATRMYELTGDIRVVQKFLGHARPETSAIYADVRPAHVKEASDQLDF